MTGWPTLDFPVPRVSTPRTRTLVLLFLGLPACQVRWPGFQPVNPPRSLQPTHTRPASAPSGHLSQTWRPHSANPTQPARTLTVASQHPASQHPASQPASQPAQPSPAVSPPPSQPPSSIHTSTHSIHPLFLDLLSLLQPSILCLHHATSSLTSIKSKPNSIPTPPPAFLARLLDPPSTPPSFPLNLSRPTRPPPRPNLPLPGSFQHPLPRVSSSTVVMSTANRPWTGC